MRALSTLLILFLLRAAFPHFCLAAPFRYEKEEENIPQVPSTPPTLLQKNATNTPHCERIFVYGGKKMECDSNLGRDGENLRPILQSVPSALSELNQYQENRQQVKLAAYFGSLGLLSAVVGVIMNHPPFINGEIKPGGYAVLGGLGLGISSFIYGFTALHANESHLEKAVQNYNVVNPQAPILLQFSTGIQF